jgi:beta-phosphoglucomutase-like phosphatase (HAD superfamily)
MNDPEKSVQVTQGIQGIIFDLDGTLLDTETLSDHAMFAALRVVPNTIDTTGTATSEGRLPY